METTSWLKQTDTPLFAELEWDKPERRDQAGSLLVVGGNLHNLSAVATAYETSTKAGIGRILIALPSKTKRLIGTALPEAQFLASTATGEFALDAKNELLGMATAADTILLAGDVGRNSQTSIVLEELLKTCKQRIVLTQDALDALSQSSELVSNRSQTTIIGSFAQIQKILAKTGGGALQFSMQTAQLVEALAAFTSAHAADIVTLHQGQLVVASSGRVTTTKYTHDEAKLSWRVEMASISACYQTWYADKPLEALTQAAYACKLQH